MNGAESLIRTAVAAGVEMCFANPGTTEMPLVAALDSADGLRAVLGLFEGVCTGAADGYGRMAEKPAMTLLHLGPGFANGIANLHNARRARSPIVNLIGDHATWHRRRRRAAHVAISFRWRRRFRDGCKASANQRRWRATGASDRGCRPRTRTSRDADHPVGLPMGSGGRAARRADRTTAPPQVSSGAIGKLREGFAREESSDDFARRRRASRAGSEGGGAHRGEIGM